jgi:phage/plasmid-associated DNA primase
MLTNFTPPTGADKSIVDRLRYVFFDSEFKDKPNPKHPNEFKVDKDFTDKLETVFLSEIFSWIAKGAKAFYDTPNNSLVMPKEFKDRSNKVLAGDDSIKSFIERKIKITNNDSDYIRKKAIFEAYKAFCDANSQRCIVRSTFYNRLEHHKIKTATLHGYDIYRGIIVVSDLDLELDEANTRIKMDEKPKIIKATQPKELTDEELETELDKLCK